MKKITNILFVLLIGMVVFLLGFGYKKQAEPNSYYQVYLNEEIIGTISSKEELNDYIDKNGEKAKTKFGVDTIYAPVGLQVKKINTYDEKLDSVSDVYKKIEQREPFTVKGYQITIKDETENQVIYVIKEHIFREAVNGLIETFVGKENYLAYINDTQKEITTVGTIIENIYIENNITIKETQIPIDTQIYTEATTLSQFLLFGNNTEKKKYIVQLGDTISKVSFLNQISPEEFLISNPEFNNINNLLYPGQEVLIGITDPQLKVVVEEHVVEDIVSNYRTEERFDEDRYIGDDEVIQQGEDGLERITQKIKRVNGTINYIDPQGKEILKPTVNKIIVRGEKYIPNVGTLTNWRWPSDSGWSLSSDYVYRINPVTFAREHHSGIDIAGTGYGSNVYAANNGTIISKRYAEDYGYYIVINHNNGYYTLYAHMSKFANVNIGDTVAKGQVIGYVGNSGYATGPHIHFELWKGCTYCRISPWSVY